MPSSSHHSARPHTVVLVAPYFPPSSLAGVHRARHLAKHLPAFGWTPIVLCVDPRHHEESLDPGLAELVPLETEVVKVGALPSRLTRAIGIGDVSLRAWTHLRRSLMALLATRPIDAVLISGSPYYPMLLASEIKRRFGAPVVLDFQDPWVSAWGASQSRLSKAGLAHRLAVSLEPRAVRAADFITSVSEVQNAEMAARYPWLDEERLAAIPIGGDPDDFAALPKNARHEERIEGDHDRIHLSYVGTLLPRSAELVRTLFRAFARLRSQQPELAARVRLNFIGTSNQPNERSAFCIRPIAEELGVADAVKEVPERLPYVGALNWVVRSDGLLLIGSDEPHYTASKIYPTLMSGRPFLSLFHRTSSAHAILSSAGGGEALSFSSESDLRALEPEIAAALRRLAADPKSFGRADETAYAAFHARSIAGQFAAIFDHLSH